MKNTQTNKKSRNTIFTTAIVVAIIMSSASIVLSLLAISTHNIQAKEDSSQIFILTEQNARQDYCIDNNVQPCTQETINQHATTKQ